jgi:hypothetical protein
MKLYLALSAHHGSAGEEALRTVPDAARWLHCLVAFPYLRVFKASGIVAKSLMLDSGAFTIWKSGGQVDLSALVAEAQSGLWNHVVALDVVGDPVASSRNAHQMQAAGLDVVPVFHFGEPWSLLAEYCADFTHVGLSCRFGEPKQDSLRWLEQCFARGWPHRFHSFGWCERGMLLRFPFFSADTASWTNSPVNFGNWRRYGQHLPLKMSKPTASYLHAEIGHYRALADEVTVRWSKEWPAEAGEGDA